MRSVAYALAPLALLLMLVSCASVLGYGLLQVTGDVLTLEKVVGKITLVLLLISIFPLRKKLQLSWRDIGFASPSVFFRQMGLGLLLGVLTLLPVLLTLYLLEVHVWDESRAWTAGKLAEKMGLALFFSLLIGLGEETLFRGLLMASLRRRMPLLLAMATTSLYFAALHFLKSKTPIAYSELTFGSAFLLMAEAFANWFNPQIISAFIALSVVGFFLAVLRSRQPRSLGLCIGCHAGWVWEIKVSKDLFNINPQTDYLYLVSTYDGVVGPLVSVWLSAAMLVYCLLRRH